MADTITVDTIQRLIRYSGWHYTMVDTIQWFCTVVDIIQWLILYYGWCYAYNDWYYTLVYTAMVDTIQWFIICNGWYYTVVHTMQLIVDTTQLIWYYTMVDTMQWLILCNDWYNGWPKTATVPLSYIVCVSKPLIHSLLYNVSRTYQVHIIRWVLQLPSMLPGSKGRHQVSSLEK